MERAEIYDSIAYPGNDGELEEIKQIEGTTVLGFVYKDGVMLAADTRVTHLIFRHIVSEKYQKYRFITDSVVATFCGGVQLFDDICKNLSSKAKQNMEKSIETTVEMVSQQAYNLVKERDVNYSMLVIGAGENKKPTIRLVTNTANDAVNSWEVIGTGNLAAKPIVEDAYDVEMSEDQAVDMAKKALLRAALVDPSTGANIIVYKFNSNKFEKLIADSVPKLLFSRNDCLDMKRTIFFLTSHVIGPTYMRHGFGLTFEGVEYLNPCHSIVEYLNPCHSIGVVRENFHLYRLTFDEESPISAADFYHSKVLSKFDGCYVPCSDPMIGALPCLYIGPALCYFAEASELKKIMEFE